MIGIASTIIVLAAVQIGAGLFAANSWGMALLPLIVVLAVVSFLHLKSGLSLLAVAVFLRIELPGFVGVYPADLLVFVLLGGLVVRALTSGLSPAISNPYNTSLLAILTVFAVSLIGAHDLPIGIRNWLRHAQMFGVIVMAATVLDGRDVIRNLRLLLTVSLVLCLPTVFKAIQIGGSQRVFGVTGIYFPFFLATGAIHCVAGYLLSGRAWQRLAWTLLGLTLLVGIVVSQTREAMLFLFIGTVFVSMLVWFWAGRHGIPKLRGRVAQLFIVGALILLIVYSGAIPLFQSSANRVHQAVEGQSNTIQIRLFLWRMGIQAFMESPYLGLGLGQIKVWEELLPLWHLDPMAQFSRGLGAHNDVISYAAETGLAGLCAIFVFFGCVFRCGWREWRQAETQEILMRLVVVWVPCLVLIVRFSFGTHTFYSLGGLFNCLYFGMLVAYTRWAEDDRARRREQIARRAI
jgi:O-antigen ligase